MQIHIRTEQASDYGAVETITRTAFWNLYVPGCNEHFIIHTLRRHPDCISQLCVVIEVDSTIVGSIFYSHSTVVDYDGTTYPTITFGPVSIAPEWQRKGLGRMLITHSIQQAKAMGYGAIIIGGYPHHYRPYGFVGAKKYHIALADGNYYTGIMALPLIDGYLDNVTQGMVYFSDALSPDERDFADFDAQFPMKEKEITPSQAEFATASTDIDTHEYHTA
jgi:predicted N-acetyltransferase YhbS